MSTTESQQTAERVFRILARLAQEDGRVCARLLIKLSADCEDEPTDDAIARTLANLLTIAPVLEIDTE